MTSSLPIEPFDTPAIGLITHPVKGGIPGRIRYGGTTWFARPYVSGLELTLAKGDIAYILARQGNTLLIMPPTEPPSELPKAESPKTSSVRQLAGCKIQGAIAGVLSDVPWQRLVSKMGIAGVNLMGSFHNPRKEPVG